MIIGLLGYPCSGRDTAARIIQYLVYKKLHSAGQLDWCLNPSNFTMFDCVTGWKVKSYQYYLFQQLSLLLGEPMDKFDNPNYLNKFLPDIWAKKYKGKKSITQAEYEDWKREDKLKNVRYRSPRDIMDEIYLSTIKINPDAYENLMFRFYNPKNDNWIITDVNTENNIRYIKDREGIILYIDRAGTGIEKKYDYKIDNTQTVKHLVDNLQKVLWKENIV